MLQRRPGEAAEAFAESLRLRPESSATSAMLARAFEECGRTGEAIRAWEQTLRLAPGHPEASAALGKATR
jgi:cytochrome c-type biogenesis protein CcmH/NrfG